MPTNKRDEYPQEALNRNLRELGLPEQSAGVEELLRHIPVVGMMRGLGQASQIHNRLQDPEFLHNTAGKGLETNLERGGPTDTYGKEADVQLMSEGGVAGVDGMETNPHPDAPERSEETAGVEIPEDVREFVDKAHKEMRESRPDEGWRITSADRGDTVAPYKKDTSAEEEQPDVAGRLKALAMPHYDEGGMVAPEDEGPGPNDPEPGRFQPVDLKDIPAAAAPMPPTAPPIVSRETIPAPSGAAPAPTDQDFMNRANKMLGLDPNQTASFMKMLGDRSQKAQIGAGVAGIGDAIASGGTLGKVNPGGLNKSEELIQGRTKEGLEGLQTIRDNQKESFGLGQTLRGNEPFSPEIQKSLVKQFHIPAGLAGSPRDVIYKMLDPIAQTQLKEAELAAANSYKTQALDLQKKQLEATIGNQKAERDIAQQGRTLEAAKAAESRGLVDKAVGLLPWTTAHKADKAIEGALTNFAPDVAAYAQKHGIAPEQAQAIKDKRMGAK